MNYKYFMEKALEQAEKALSVGEFPVGCVIVYQNKIVASNYRKGVAGNSINELDHAEINALRNLKNNIDKSQTTLFCTLEPCFMCYGAILLSGIAKIVYAYEDVMGGCTKCDLAALAPLYQKSRVSIMPNILRQKSLDLFKRYFSNPKNTYWKKSLLAEYTLQQ